MKPLWNFLAFQAGWFACILLAAAGHPLWGAASVLPVVGLHLAFVARPRAEIAFIVGGALVGSLCDGALGSFGLVEVQGTEGVGATHLLWFAALWANFVTTLDSSLRWLQPRPWLGAIFGLVGGPAAYLAGERLDAIRFPDGGGPALLAIAGLWTLATPLLTEVARRRTGPPA